MNLSIPDNAQPKPSAENVLEQMERVLASRHFRQTRTLDKFLRHAVTKTLEGLESELKELLIGREVFHRGEDFNPAIDAVVRVQAGMLRKKLASYYEDEGVADSIVIGLPKGCYVPTFEARAAQLEPVLTTTTDEAIEPDVVSPPTDSLSFSEQVVTRPWSVPSWWRIPVAFALGVICMLGVSLWGNQRNLKGRSLPPATQVTTATPLWEKFFEPDSTTILAYGTPLFFQFNGLYLRDVIVNSPQEVDAGGRLAVVRKALNASFDPVEVYTGVGEAHGINTLSRFFWQNSRELKIARSRLVGWQEVKNSNLIFLSSMRFHTLAEQLEYPNDFVIKADGVSGTVANLRPAPGEQAEYGSQGGEHYAVITLWPGKAEHRRILQLSGNTTWGTLAAAEYATDQEALRKLRDTLEQCRLQSGKDRHPEYFQVLVRAEVKDLQPIALTYVTHHDLEVPLATPESVRAALK